MRDIGSHDVFMTRGNHETRSFASWVARTAGLNSARMVANALARARARDPLALGLNLSHSARAELAGVLEEILCRARRDEGVMGWTPWAKAESESASLFALLLSDAVKRINCDIAAELLLRYHGAWDEDPRIREQAELVNTLTGGGQLAWPPGQP